jgi:6-phosphogluconolactonase/glucosamine-6-phosphate isomerase/deaminase
MVLKKITNKQPVVDYLVTTINQHLAHGERVLWLVPGGSAIDVATEVGKQLTVPEKDQLLISLTDERYGDIGHKDSNWKQLADKGFHIKNAKMAPVLCGKPMHETAVSFANTLRYAFDEVDYRIGLFGIGPDGHTAGILPGSPAVDADDFACGYNSDTFQRITMTFPAIEQLDETVVYAFGDEKRVALENLLHPMSLDQEPAQIHRNVLQSTIFNDQKEGEV